MTAEDVAEAGFFSFSTNDLTQTVWGFSRDDVEGVVFRNYRGRHLRCLPLRVHRRPAWAPGPRRRAPPATKPNIKLGVCILLRWRPWSIHFFHNVVADSCPAPVPRPPSPASRLARRIEDHVDMTA